MERYAYSAYGEPVFVSATGTVLTSSAKDNRHTYTGREWDEELSLYHFRARMYDAENGRFCGRDPAGFRDGASLYRSYIDLSGQDPMGLEVRDRGFHFVPLSEVRENCAATSGACTRGSHDLEGVDDYFTWHHKKCDCFCAKMEKPALFHVTIETWVPNDQVNVLFTQRGFEEVVGHETRTRDTYLKPYNAYLEPANALVAKAKLCRKRPGEALAMIKDYVTAVREQAKTQARRYEVRAIIGVEKENTSRHTVDHDDDASTAEIFDHFTYVYEMPDPSKFIPQKHPESDCSLFD